ncbi:MAG: ABC transporter permease subunit [Chloroflexota bacterium]
MTALPAMPDRPALEPEPTKWASLWASLVALVTKEARWRMRGRRAFVIVTIYLVLLALLVAFVYQTLVDQAMFQASFNEGFNDGFGFPPVQGSDFVPGSVSARIGQAVFAAILILQTLLTVLLAPALTSGAVSTEREKQTLELLITTPVSTLGMVTGKLFSSLAYLFLLIVASVPLMSLVFAFGGVAPDDVVRAYILLFAVAIGLGSIGLFMSALTKRTQLATALSYVIVFSLVIAAFALHSWMFAAAQFNERGRFLDADERPVPPVELLLLNPFVADLDLMCTAIPDPYGGTCSYPSTIVGFQLDTANPPRDLFWPRSAFSFLLVGIVLTLGSTQLIAPSRRFRRLPPLIPRDPEAAAGAPAVPTMPVSPRDSAAEAFDLDLAADAQRSANSTSARP